MRRSSCSSPTLASGLSQSSCITCQSLRMTKGTLPSRTGTRGGHVIIFVGNNKARTLCYCRRVVSQRWSIPHGSEDRELMYLTTKKYIEIGPIRAPLTSFMVQTVSDEMIREVEDVIKPTSRLHISKRRTRNRLNGWILVPQLSPTSRI